MEGLGMLLNIKKNAQDSQLLKQETGEVQEVNSADIEWGTLSCENGVHKTSNKQTHRW